MSAYEPLAYHAVEVGRTLEKDNGGRKYVIQKGRLHPKSLLKRFILYLSPQRTKHLIMQRKIWKRKEALCWKRK